MGRYMVTLVFLDDVEAKSASQAAASIYERLYVIGDPPLKYVTNAYSSAGRYQSQCKWLELRHRNRTNED